MNRLLMLLLLLMMFPQLAETIYSPALPDIASHFGVTTETAGLTLSCYFIAFAAGVVFWGILADYSGRRRAMLLGLGCYSLACVVALWATGFYSVLLARICSAFAIACASVVTQTILRDRHQGAELARFFSYMGIAIALSPVVGLLAGAWLTTLAGYHGVFSGMALSAVVLLLDCCLLLPETAVRRPGKISLLSLAGKIIRDFRLWQYALLVALFNILLFSYYLHGPFIFKALGFSDTAFGFSGIALGVATLLGSLSNAGFLRRGVTPRRLISFACLLALTGCVGIFYLRTSIWLLLPMMWLVYAYAIAIPNLLSGALVHFQTQLGSASALFGLMYYLMIGAGLAGSSYCYSWLS